MFSYAKVEAVLARVFNVPQHLNGAFRARLTNFRKLGLSPAQPGSGKRVAYTFPDVYVWAFALTLAEFGIDPRLIVRIVKAEDTAQFFASRPGGADSIISYVPELFYSDETRPLYTRWSAHEIKDIDDITQIGSRFAVINISDLKRRIDAALNA